MQTGMASLHRSADLNPFCIAVSGSNAMKGSRCKSKFKLSLQALWLRLFTYSLCRGCNGQQQRRHYQQQHWSHGSMRSSHNNEDDDVLGR